MRDVEADGQQSDILSTFNDLFWVQHVARCTRYRGTNKPSLLDLVFTRTKAEVDEIDYQHGLGLSDHIVMLFSISIEKLIQSCEKAPRCNYRKANLVKARTMLKEINWKEEFKDRNVNQCYEKLIQVHQNIDEECVPWSKPRKSTNKSRWITKVVKSEIKKRTLAWKDYTNQPNEQNENLYKKQRNRTLKEKRKSKFKFEENLVEKTQSRQETVL